MKKLKYAIQKADYSQEHFPEVTRKEAEDIFSQLEWENMRREMLIVKEEIGDACPPTLQYIDNSKSLMISVIKEDSFSILLLDSKSNFEEFEVDDKNEVYTYIKCFYEKKYDCFKKVEFNGKNQIFSEKRLTIGAILRKVKWVFLIINLPLIPILYLFTHLVVKDQTILYTYLLCAFGVWAIWEGITGFVLMKSEVDHLSVNRECELTKIGDALRYVNYQLCFIGLGFMSFYYLFYIGF